jgi:hypothetical protein
MESYSLSHTVFDDKAKARLILSSRKEKGKK